MLRPTLAAGQGFLATGLVSLVVMVDSCVCDSSTFVVCPPISIQVAMSFSFIVDFSSRPFDG